MSVASVVAVFGASSPREGTATYAEARELGALLAQSGYIVATGGYRGVMEASSRGASEAGGHVIGVTCERIEALVPGLRPNRWVAEEIRFRDLRERLSHLVIESQAAIAMPGGIGTLSNCPDVESYTDRRNPLQTVDIGWTKLAAGGECFPAAG